MSSTTTNTHDGGESNGRATGVAGETSPLERDEVFDMLSCQRRRDVVHYLLRTEEPVDLRFLSRQVAAWENGVELEQVTAKQRKRVYTALHQSHLPKLDECGAIVYDSDRSVVEPTPRLSDLEIYLEIVPENEISWSSYYIGLGLLGMAVTLASATGLVPFAGIPGEMLAAGVSVLVIGSGLAHRIQNSEMALGNQGRPPDAREDR